MKALIIGTGLIGGSFALALKAVRPNAEIIGMDAEQAHLQQALDLGIIDRKGGIEAVEEADLVLLATPVSVATNMLGQVLDRIGDDALVMDMGSIKERLCLSVSNHKRRGNYLAAHPIAGTEYSGPAAALATLYRNKKLRLLY